MQEPDGPVLGYLAYRNKRQVMAWAERLWRQHLAGGPPDIRAEEDRRRYVALVMRLDRLRSLARTLHARRMVSAPPFARLAHLRSDGSTAGSES